MSTDKALAVMTGEHLAMMQDVQCVYRSSASLKPLRDIESLVCYLVDHPERLAGEDEVVVKREAAKFTDFICGESDNGYICNLPPSHTCAHVAIAHDHVVHEWLAGSPTAQESKESE